jgi:RNA polymerase sigma factor (sigma-70 family)
MGSEVGSVTSDVAALKRGDEEAVRRLWDRYFPLIVKLARKRFRANRRGAVAEGPTDAAALAFHQLCDEIAQQSASISAPNREEFFRNLANRTRSRVIDILRRESAAKRGGLLNIDGEMSFEEFASAIQTPAHLVIDRDDCDRFLESLNDEVLRKIVQLRQEDYTIAEISEHLNCSEATVNRKMKRIRELWEERRRVRSGRPAGP